MKYLSMCNRSKWKCSLNCTLLFLNSPQSRVPLIYIGKISGTEIAVEICIVLLLYIGIQVVSHYLEQDFPFALYQLLTSQMCALTNLENPLYYFLGTCGKMLMYENMFSSWDVKREHFIIESEQHKVHEQDFDSTQLISWQSHGVLYRLNRIHSE